MKVIREFWKPFISQVKTVEKEAKRAAIPVEKTGKKCPKCGEGELVIRAGKFGKFLSCSRFPECKFTQNYREVIDGIVCSKCQKGEVVVKRTRKGRTFYGCSRYPECDWASWTDPRQKDGQERQGEKNGKGEKS